MKRIAMCGLAFLVLSGMAFAQDVDDLMGKIKGVKKLTANLLVVLEKGEEPFMDFVAEFNEQSDVLQYQVIQGGSAIKTMSYSYTYDPQGRKTSIIRRNGLQCVESKMFFSYNADGSYTRREEEYVGEKPGEEKIVGTIIGIYNSKGQILSADRNHSLYGKSSTKYIYDGKGFLKEIRESVEGAVSVALIKNDDRGNPVEVVHKDDKGKPAGREVYEYDLKNNWTLHYEYTGLGTLEKKEGKIITYNDRDQPSELVMNMYDSDKPDTVKFSIRIKTAYEYLPKKEEKK